MLISKIEYYWQGTLSELKLFVETNLKLQGKWSSQGGEVKLLTSSTTNLSVKWHGLKRKRLEVMKDNEVNYLFNAFKNHAADDSVNSRSDEPCQSLNAKYDIAIAELDLEVTILTASLHKEQEKVVSHSVRIGEIEKQIQNLIADNNKQTAQSVHEKVAINMPNPEYKLPTNNADKSNQNEGVTLNSQKSRVESNMSVIDLSHLVSSENLNNYSNISNAKGNTLLNNVSYEDNECIAINNSTTMHVAPVMENNSRHNTSTITELASEPPTPGTIAHKHTHQEKDSSIRYTNSQDTEYLTKQQCSY